MRSLKTLAGVMAFAVIAVLALGAFAISSIHTGASAPGESNGTPVVVYLPFIVQNYAPGMETPTPSPTRTAIPHAYCNHDNNAYAQSDGDGDPHAYCNHDNDAYAQSDEDSDPHAYCNHDKDAYAPVRRGQRRLLQRQRGRTQTQHRLGRPLLRLLGYGWAAEATSWAMCTP